MTRFIFELNAFDDYNNWDNHDIKIFRKIRDLLKEIKRNPYRGTGKPEALKHEFSGYWSRRITAGHRLVYKVSGDEITILSCKGHYLI